MNAGKILQEKPIGHDASCVLETKTTEQKSAERLKNLVCSLLRRDFGANVIVDDLMAKSLTAAGQNYASTMLEMTVTMRKKELMTSEVVHVIAKMLPPDGLFSGLFDTLVTFSKEIAAYEEILPAYEKLQQENGIPRNKIFDNYPKCYGTWFSNDLQNRMKNKDVVILMENLKVAGYSCGDRINGLDLVDSEMAVRSLANFHALGIAVKIKKPELFARFKTKAIFLDYPANVVHNEMKNMKKIALQSEQLNPFYEKIANGLDIGMEKLIASTSGHFGTICHGDFWVNNIMFHRDVDGKPDGVKFLDFQTYSYQSSVRDLIHFVIVTTAETVLLRHFDHLFKLYHERFVEVLEELNCDVTKFGQDQFIAECKEWTNAEAIHCGIMMKVTLLPESDEIGNDPVARSLDYFTNLEFGAYTERITKMFQRFLDKEWM